MSIFDLNSLTETVYKGEIPNADWVLVPEWEGPMQCTKIEGREVQGQRVEGTFVFLDLSWEILDDEIRKATNMEHPTASQSFSIAMLNGKNQLDLGINQNMPLKNVWKACGIHTNPSINKILNQTAWGQVKHEPMKDSNGNALVDADGKPMMRARVTRVTSLDAAAQRQRQRQAAE